MYTLICIYTYINTHLSISINAMKLERYEPKHTSFLFPFSGLISYLYVAHLFLMSIFFIFIVSLFYNDHKAAICFDHPQNISLPSSPVVWLRSLKRGLKLRTCAVLWAGIFSTALQIWATTLSTRTSG